MLEVVVAAVLVLKRLLLVAVLLLLLLVVLLLVVVLHVRQNVMLWGGAMVRPLNPHSNFLHPVALIGGGGIIDVAIDFAVGGEPKRTVVAAYTTVATICGC